ncbi:MAG: hypothetical protein ACRDRH_09155 [Pseudonocardia sp.]
MWHTVFITLHAASGIVAFVAGLAALPLGRFFATYRWSLVAMVGFLLLAIAAGWAETESGAVAVLGALLALAAVMVGRSERAARMLPAHTGGPTVAYVHHVGFGLVGLFDAFWVVTLLRVGLPGWMVVGAGVGIAVGGHLILTAPASRVASSRRLPLLYLGSESQVSRTGLTDVLVDGYAVRLAVDDGISARSAGPAHPRQGPAGAMPTLRDPDGVLSEATDM